MMRHTLFVFVALLLSVCVSDPTTPYIKHIFTGKCLQRNPERPAGEEYCMDLWQHFEAGAHMDMNMVVDKDFDAFFGLASFATVPDNALFWSGTKDFASKLSADGTYFTTLEETATGSILNGLTWCGNAYRQGVPPSFDYVNNCNYAQNGSYYGDQGVWKRSSQIFAQSVVGQVNVLLQPQQLYYNSGPYIAFRNTSIFYTVELPSMNVTAVTAMRILLIVDLDNAPTETCGNGSLAQLQKEVVKRFGFAPQCIDDPEEILNILCEQQDGTSPECAVASRCKSTPPTPSVLPLILTQPTPPTEDPRHTQGVVYVWAVVGGCVSVTLLATVVVLAVTIVRMRRAGGYARVDTL